MNNQFVQYERVSYDAESDILYIVKKQGTYKESDKDGNVITNFDDRWEILSREILHPKNNEELIRWFLFNTPIAVWA